MLWGFELGFEQGFFGLTEGGFVNGLVFGFNFV